jgi:hypothetical protein
MKAEVTLTVRVDGEVVVDLENEFAGNALDHLHKLVDSLAHVGQALRPLEPRATKLPDSPPSSRALKPEAEAKPPPKAVAETNGHGPKAATDRRTRRKFTDEEKRAGAARAREIGATKAAEEFDVVPTVVRGWLKKHPKEHAAGPITGTPPAVGESREDWEARKRAAAGMAL